MSGVKVTNERPARPIPAVESVDGTVDDENVDWEPGTTTGIPPGTDPGDVLTWDGDSWEPEPPTSGSAIEALDEGVSLTATVASIDFVGAGVTATVIGDDVTVTIPGGALPWFDVTDYGATGNGTTDDTSSIQAAIDAAEAAGGGIVFFPRGVYKVAGALQDTGRSNAQLLLPRIDTTDEQITVELRGEAAPAAIPYISGASVDPDLGSVIKSTLGAGTGQVIGSWGPSGSSDDFTLLRAVLRNLIVRTVANPTNSGVDLSHVEAAELHDVIIDAGEYTMSSISTETTSTSYGLKLPANNNGASTRLETVNVVGFYNGILAGEHTIGDNVAVWACRIALEFPFGNHASHFDRLGTYHCAHGIAITGVCYFSIDQWNIEHASSGTWVPIADIDDVANHGHGHIAWHVVLQGTGTDHTLTVNGATGIYLLELGDDPFGGSGSSAAVDVTITDAGGFYTATDVEAALAQLGPAVDLAGLILVDPGSNVVDTGTPPGVTVTTKWGIDTGAPYYDSVAADTGEEAALFWDPATSHYVLIAYDF